VTYQCVFGLVEDCRARRLVRRSLRRKGEEPRVKIEPLEIPREYQALIPIIEMGVRTQSRAKLNEAVTLVDYCRICPIRIEKETKPYHLV